MSTGTGSILRGAHEYGLGIITYRLLRRSTSKSLVPFRVQAQILNSRLAINILDNRRLTDRFGPLRRSQPRNIELKIRILRTEVVDYFSPSPTPLFIAQAWLETMETETKPGMARCSLWEDGAKRPRVGGQVILRMMNCNADFYNPTSAVLEPRKDLACPLQVMHLF